MLGPGRVGGFLAAALARVGLPVTVVAREETADAIARSGLDVRSVRLGDFHVPARAVSRLEDEPGVIFVCTKAPDLELALERVADRAAGSPVVVPLLNGLEHMHVLRRRFGRRVAAGSIRVECKRTRATGPIVQSSPFLLVELAADGAVERSRLEAIGALLRRAEVPVRVLDSEAAVLWRKLVRLNAAACTTSASGRPMGWIRANAEWRGRLEGCLREAAAVANADGAQISVEAALEQLDEVHDSLSSSMSRDIAAGRPCELEAIPGAVLRAAERHGLSCPITAELVGQIRERIDAGRHPRPRAST